MVGNDYKTWRNKRAQREFYERLWQMSITGLAVGGMAALGAVTVLGFFGAL